MLKIPTLFARARGHAGPVIDEHNPDVVSWLAYAAPETLSWSRKVDGTCTMFDGVTWWGRREVKPGQHTPTQFQQVAVDPNTGNKFGWVPIFGSQWETIHDEALANLITDTGGVFPSGTYELVGPKVNGNPEGIDRHVLVNHGALVIPMSTVDLPPMFEPVKAFLDGFNAGPDDYFEGLILTHNPTGRRAKIKHKDYTAK